jgi:hypothetical protein
MYCFLVSFNIPNRLGLFLVRSWQANVHGMLRRIPIISTDGLDAYFGTIDSNLTVYENLSDDSTLLELALQNNDIVLSVPPFITLIAMSARMR